MPDVSAVIVNWNTRDLLCRCLDSLAGAEDGLHLQVIVVDNASSDGSQEIVRMEYPWVTLLVNSINAGFARANNQGATLADAPLLLLVNSDTTLQPGALSAAAAYMRDHPGVAIAGLQLLNDDLTLQPSGKRFPTLFSTIMGLLPIPERWRVAYDRHRNARDYARTTEVDEVSGAALIVRRDVFAALGGFDEGFYFFGEDIDLCWRAVEDGWRVAYLPQAQAIHSWGGARKRTPSIRQGLMSQRAQYRLLQRHRPQWQAAMLRCFLITLTAARLLRAIVCLGGADTREMHMRAHLYAHELVWLGTSRDASRR